MSAVALHHVVSGPVDAPAVVLTNSLGSTVAMWDANVPALEQHFRVIRVDTRGHGGSPVPDGPYDIDDLVDDVVAVLDELGVERVHFVGLSLGGMIAMRFAIRHPERIDRLVVLSTSALLGPASGWHDRARLVRADGTGAVAPAVVPRWFTEGYLDRLPEVRTRFEAMVASTPSEGYASCCEVIAHLDLTADLATITAPTLAIAAAADHATPPEHLQRIADGVADGRVLVVDDAAHLPNVEQPEIVTRAIIEHLEDR